VPAIKLHPADFAEGTSSKEIIVPKLRRRICRKSQEGGGQMMLNGDMARRSAARFPKRPAILWQGQSLSYAELDAAGNRLANALTDSGLNRQAEIGLTGSGERVGGIGNHE
jgi:non-ribosomal peptide synthetase component E (peptide arylation enzyme)